MTVGEKRSVFRIGERSRAWPMRVASRAAERLLGLNGLGRIHARVEQREPSSAFLRGVLEEFDVRSEVTDCDLERIPTQGPTLVLSNHPYGGMEGMVLADLLLSIRPDVKVMANYLLGRIPELEDLFLLVDPFGGDVAAARSLRGLREAFKWLDNGGLLLVFPAGEVAHLDLRQRRVTDPAWNPAVSRLALRSGATALPVYVAGHNGSLFQLLGLLHPRLRTLMLPRQLLALRGATLDIRIGTPIPAHRIDRDADDRQTVQWLRGCTEVLAERVSAAESGQDDAIQPRRTPSSAVPVAPAPPPHELDDEIQGLPADSLLVESGDQLVFEARANEIPRILREIGRLRELSFREVGEGTGKELDLDPFDATYRHLFIWSQSRKEVIGAYRIGLSDCLLEAQGLNGLYTSTLFRFSTQLFQEMGPALEMGRSFIRAEYQRSFAGLMLLWKGVGQFVLRRPRYPVLFGPVSISADYRAASQQLITAFLRRNNYVHDWSRWVRPRSPYRPRRSAVLRHGVSGLKTIDEVSRFIAEIEDGGRGIPILLRQYLKLGGRLLGFNVDPGFSDVLDVLIMVDLRQTEPRILERYMGASGAESFLRGLS
ncbi:MAG: lysophospholipid acyltransferase family protein [bacterium]|nr:lysophospholipid acyltransferase family protein [bacterium]